jgi:hypothetical protein
VLSKKEIAPKIRRIGYYVETIQNRYISVLFHLTATDSINNRVVEALKEIRGLAEALLDNVDELLRELGEEEQ